MVIGEDEYKTRDTLPAFAAEHLNSFFRVTYLFSDDAKDRNSFPDLEKLDDADVVLISVRRRALPPEQMASLRKHVAAGKPVVGIRTACHAFSLRGKKPPAGRITWERFDPEVFGGNYVDHYGDDLKITLRQAEGAAEHPIMAGVRLDELKSNGSLYRVRPLADSAVPLLFGSLPGKHEEPVAWTNTRKDGGRVFYTSLGHPDDFKSPAFQRLLVNGICWAARIESSK
jgi:type 1 glutamine amidotransferase